MLSGRLIHLIESHWDEITARALRQIHGDSRLAHIGRLPELELREWGQETLENLGHWLSGANEEDLGQKYEELGRLRFDESVPLHEAVYAIAILKEKIIDFMKEQAPTKTSLQLYAEEELEHRLSRFFDVLIVHLVKGYESAWRRAAHAIA